MLLKEHKVLVSEKALTLASTPPKTVKQTSPQVKPHRIDLTFYL